jgi:hypothetical protein
LPFILVAQQFYDLPFTISVLYLLLSLFKQKTLFFAFVADLLLIYFNLLFFKIVLFDYFSIPKFFITHAILNQFTKSLSFSTINLYLTSHLFLTLTVYFHFKVVLNQSYFY